MNKISKIILSKLIWILAAFVAFYMIGIALGIVPKYMTDTVAWFSENFTVLVIFICFMTSCYVVLQFLNRHKKKDSE